MPDKNDAAEREIQEVLSHTPDEAQQIDQIAKIRNYLRPKDTSNVYPLVQEYINEKANLDVVIEKITKPIDDEVAKTGNWEEEVDWWDFWYSVLHSARRISFRTDEGHKKLVDLVKAYKEHPEPTHQGEQGIYERLLYLGIASREFLDNAPGLMAGYTTPELHAFTNLHCLFAHLTREGVREYWIYCIWAMRDALEDQLEDDKPEYRKDISGTAIQKYNAFVPAAAVWVLVLGKALYEREEDRTPTDSNQGNPARGGYYWKGKAEFSKARWELWKQRFGRICEMKELSEETRQIAKETVARMEESENA
ncbi:hypothetical protein K491DRAFT_195380 [Lophiostoma macrostomum CBS 122681]|uniref:Uncharacterized protein n=1 Tax=Lophiostoma macrostomum CBS 122681 TaxID=1314788 RepID=A0A6A6TLG8_9PLEO|nr:hypothetical protein K491DRAFT_195380 [Lophiostoma macrostomum CBS 122681]